MLKKLIGNTPIIKIKYKYNKAIRNTFAKLEYYNLTGSIKDRIAYYILNQAMKNKKLKKGMPVIEATSGNTGISFAALASALGHPTYIFMPDWASKERIDLMKLYGAKVILISKEQGGFRECIKQADLLANKLNGYRPDQFSNIHNIDCHYQTTGKEIIEDLKNYQINAFISGIGTGGTLIGIGKRLKEYDCNIKLIALEPKTMTLLSNKKIIGSHKIEGIGDDFIPRIVDKNLIDEVILIDDKDAINMSRKISKTFGIGVGISSGANFLASVLSNYDNVVTVFADDSKKYLSTDLTKEIDKNPELISNQIELISIKVI